MPNTLINVSNRLPVTVQEDQILKSSGGLVAALEGFPEEHFKTNGSDGRGPHFPMNDGEKKSSESFPKSMAISRSFWAKKKLMDSTKVFPIPVSGLCCTTYRISCDTNVPGGKITKL